MGKTKLRFISLFFKRLLDCYRPKSFTTLSLMVPKPTNQEPYPAILVSLRNGHSKLFFRVRDLQAYKAFWQLTVTQEEQLNKALLQAEIEANQIESDIRLILQRRRLPEGVALARTDTGEVVSEGQGAYHA